MSMFYEDSFHYVLWRFFSFYNFKQHICFFSDICRTNSSRNNNINGRINGAAPSNDELYASIQASLGGNGNGGNGNGGNGNGGNGNGGTRSNEEILEYARLLLSINGNGNNGNGVNDINGGNNVDGGDDINGGNNVSGGDDINGGNSNDVNVNDGNEDNGNGNHFEGQSDGLGHGGGIEASVSDLSTANTVRIQSILEPYNGPPLPPLIPMHDNRNDHNDVNQNETEYQSDASGSIMDEETDDEDNDDDDDEESLKEEESSDDQQQSNEQQNYRRSRLFSFAPIQPDNNRNQRTQRTQNRRAPNYQRTNYPRIQVGGLILSIPSYLRYPTTEEYIEERPYACIYPGCGYRPKKRSWLARHYATHSNAKPFRCSRLQCARRYKRRCELRRHIREVHERS